MRTSWRLRRPHMCRQSVRSDERCPLNESKREKLPLLHLALSGMRDCSEYDDDDDDDDEGDGGEDDADAGGPENGFGDNAGVGTVMRCLGYALGGPVVQSCLPLRMRQRLIGDDENGDGGGRRRLLKWTLPYRRQLEPHPFLRSDRRPRSKEGIDGEISQKMKECIFSGSCLPSRGRRLSGDYRTRESR